MNPTPHGEEVSTVPPTLIAAAVLATAALTASAWSWWQIRKMRRALARERAVALLTSAAAQRDREAMQRRIRAAIAEQQNQPSPDTEAAVLAAADQVLTTAIHRYVRDTPEGGPTC